ncbi:hypothetical protein [Streptococcus ovis]|uniref:hypothetical protein n=1 Tax=Streptococcus ovis TaxID=82806 RepID=UPI000377672C|nr:hypothetical protein [Streptococcus ovis]
MSFNKNKFGLVFFLLVAFIEFPLRLKGMGIISSLFLYALPITYIFFNLGWVVQVFTELKKSVFFLVLIGYMYLLGISLLLPILFGTFDFSFLTIYWFGFSAFFLKNLFLIIAFDKYFATNNGSKVEQFINYFLNALTLYISFSLVLILIPSLRSLLLNILEIDSKFANYLTLPTFLTRFGWSGWSGFDFTIWSTLGVLFCIVLSVFYKNNRKKQVRYLMRIPIYIMGNMFYGRTGLVVSAISLVVLVFILAVNLKFGYLIKVMLLGASGIILLVFVKSHISFLNEWYNWMFSAFINFYQKGRFVDNVGSVSRLKEMYWIPEISTLLFGDFKYTDLGHYYMSTDIGFMRHLLFYGIINYFLEVLFAVSVGFKFVRIFFKKFNLDRFLLSILMVLVIVMFEMKGETLFYIISIILPIVMLAVKERKIDHSNHVHL